jgi:hypothetical protein
LSAKCEENAGNADWEYIKGIAMEILDLGKNDLRRIVVNIKRVIQRVFGYDVLPVPLSTTETT